MTPRLDMIGLVVHNMAASLAFYRRLGVEIPPGSDGEEHVEATLPGGMRLAWDTPAVMHIFDPGWTPATGGAAFSLAFLVDSPNEVDKVYTEMTGHGYEDHIAPFDAFWGQRYAVVKDPDGNDVALFAGNPES